MERLTEDGPHVWEREMYGQQYIARRTPPAVDLPDTGALGLSRHDGNGGRCATSLASFSKIPVVRAPTVYRPLCTVWKRLAARHPPTICTQYGGPHRCRPIWAYRWCFAAMAVRKASRSSAVAESKGRVGSEADWRCRWAWIAISAMGRRSLSQQHLGIYRK